MRELKTLAKAILAAAAVVIGFNLLIMLPLAAVALLGFLFGETELLLFAPGFALYVLGFCLPAGFIHWQRRNARRPSAPLRLPSVGLLVFGAALSVGVGPMPLVLRAAPGVWAAF